MAADVINVVSLSAKLSPDVVSVASANSDTVRSATFNVTAPVVPPPVSPVPAVTPVISPTSVVYPFDSIKSLIAFEVMMVVSLSANDSDDVVIEFAAISFKVKLETANDTSPDVPPPESPVPAFTAVISPVVVVYPLEVINASIAADVIIVESLEAKDSD